MKRQDKYNYIKNLLNGGGYTTCVGGFYYNHEAVELFENKNFNFHLNEYYDLPLYSVLNLIKEYDSINDMKNGLKKKWKEWYADDIYYNFINILDQVKIRG